MKTKAAFVTGKTVVNYLKTRAATDARTTTSQKWITMSLRCSRPFTSRSDSSVGVKSYYGMTIIHSFSMQFSATIKENDKKMQMHVQPPLVVSRLDRGRSNVPAMLARLTLTNSWWFQVGIPMIIDVHQYAQTSPSYAAVNKAVWAELIRRLSDTDWANW